MSKKNCTGSPNNRLIRDQEATSWTAVQDVLPSMPAISASVGGDCEEPVACEINRSINITFGNCVSQHWFVSMDTYSTIQRRCPLLEDRGCIPLIQAAERLASIIEHMQVRLTSRQTSLCAVSRTGQYVEEICLVDKAVIVCVNHCKRLFKLFNLRWAAGMCAKATGGM